MERLKQNFRTHRFSLNNLQSFDQISTFLEQFLPFRILANTEHLLNILELSRQRIRAPDLGTMLEHIPDPPQQLRCPMAGLAEEHCHIVGNSIFNRNHSLDLLLTNCAASVGPVRAAVTPNPAACVDIEIEPVADHTHAEVAEASPAAADIAVALLSWENTLAGDVLTSLVGEDLRETAPWHADIFVQICRDPHLEGNKHLQLHMVSRQKRCRCQVRPDVDMLLKTNELLYMALIIDVLHEQPERDLEFFQQPLCHGFHFAGNNGDVAFDNIPDGQIFRDLRMKNEMQIRGVIDGDKLLIIYFHSNC